MDKFAGSLDYLDTKRVLEFLGHKVTFVSSGKVWQFAKDAIAMLFVEIWRLETERIQICVLGAAFPCFIFGAYQEAMSISTTAEFLFEPQQIDVKPIPIR
jgi:hypothetical protein